jgi:hypothetical protein
MATSQLQLTNNILNDYVRLLAQRDRDRVSRIEVNKRYYEKTSREREDMSDDEREKLERIRESKRAHQRAYYAKNKEKIRLKTKLRRLNKDK